MMLLPDGGCNVCGDPDPDNRTDVGTVRGESGSIGLILCGECWEAAKWHSENTENSRCVNCGEPESRTTSLAEPSMAHRDPESCEISMCRDCYRKAGGLMHAYKSSVSFRAIANVASEWDTQRQQALRRDDVTCQSCGVGDCRLHVHHEVPRSEGGTDHVDNLTSLCPDCHADRHDQQACQLCGGLEDVEQATWHDADGGVAVYFCEHCHDYMDRGKGSERCVICARFTDDSSRSDGVSFFSDWEEGEGPGPLYEACDECRVVLLSSSWARRQKYVDDQLPDSHVNVRHWEVSS